MKLTSLYDEPAGRHLLWTLLAEREPHQNISHKTMPTSEAHRNYIASRPHPHWYVFSLDGPVPYLAGAIYLSHQREIGIGVLKAYQGLGLASQAIKELMRLHPGRFMANINPANEASIALFRKLGFGGPIQLTFEKP